MAHPRCSALDYGKISPVKTSSGSGTQELAGDCLPRKTIAQELSDSITKWRSGGVPPYPALWLGLQRCLQVPWVPGCRRLQRKHLPS